MCHDNLIIIMISDVSSSGFSSVHTDFAFVIVDGGILIFCVQTITVTVCV